MGYPVRIRIARRRRMTRAGGKFPSRQLADASSSNATHPGGAPHPAPPHFSPSSVALAFANPLNQSWHPRYFVVSGPSPPPASTTRRFLPPGAPADRPPLNPNAGRRSAANTRSAPGSPSIPPADSCRSPLAADTDRPRRLPFDDLPEAPPDRVALLPVEASQGSSRSSPTCRVATS